MELKLDFDVMAIEMVALLIAPLMELKYRYIREYRAAQRSF